jgi:hypothetical protein
MYRRVSRDPVRDGRFVTLRLFEIFCCVDLLESQKASKGCVGRQHRRQVREVAKDVEKPQSQKRTLRYGGVTRQGSHGWCFPNRALLGVRRTHGQKSADHGYRWCNDRGAGDVGQGFPRPRSGRALCNPAAVRDLFVVSTVWKGGARQ